MSGSKPGERRGGRQAGTRNKRTTELIERAEVSGVKLPVDMMLTLARDAYERWERYRDALTGMCVIPVSVSDECGGKVEVIDWGKRAMGYAAECAPYYHATLKAIDAEISGDVVMNVNSGVERAEDSAEDD